MRLMERQVAALLLLRHRLDVEAICEELAQALDELAQLGLVKFEPFTVEESEMYIMFSGEYWELTEKGEKARGEHD